MRAPDDARRPWATDDEVATLAASTGAAVLRGALAAAATCAASGCALCEREQDLYRRALARRQGAVQARNHFPQSAVDTRNFPAAHEAQKPRASLSSVRTSTNKEQVIPPRTPPTPVGGGADHRRRLAPPTRKERARALLTRERYRVTTEDHNPCRHEPTCQSEDECVGRLVEYARAELAAGQAQERAALARRREPMTVTEPTPQLLDASFLRRPRKEPR